MARFFIDRPIFAWVIAIVIMLGGALSIRQLPVSQYPSIAPPAIVINAKYPGASAKAVEDSVTQIIEQKLTGLDGLLYMKSTSDAYGNASTTLTFSADTDPDIAQVQVQNRVNLALPALPEAVQQQGVSVQKKSSSIMMLVAVTGKGGRYSADYVANYANVYVLDALKRVPGAGQAQIMGVPDQAMRIWMNPDRMASLGITTSDIANAVNQQNALFGAGQIGQDPSPGNVQLTFPVVTQGQFADPRQYERIILRANSDGSAIVRLGDVARAEVGLRQYIVDSQLNREPATLIAIYQQPGANGLVVSNAVRKTLDEMRARFPEAVARAGCSRSRVSKTSRLSSITVTSPRARTVALRGERSTSATCPSSEPVGMVEMIRSASPTRFTTSTSLFSSVATFSCSSGTTGAALCCPPGSGVVSGDVVTGSQRARGLAASAAAC